MGEWGIHEKGFTGNFQLLVSSHVIERAHVVQTIGEFDEDYAHVI